MITDTIKLTAVPNNNTNASIAVKLNPNFTSFSKLAPNIVGIAKKNVNSAAIVLDKNYSIEQMEALLEFQERFFKHKIITE